MSKNLDLLTNENFHLRKELEMLVEQNQGSTNQVEEYTEKITGLEVTNHKTMIFNRILFWRVKLEMSEVMRGASAQSAVAVWVAIGCDWRTFAANTTNEVLGAI